MLTVYRNAWCNCCEYPKTKFVGAASKGTIASKFDDEVVKIADVTVKEFETRANIIRAHDEMWRKGPLWEGSLNGKKMQVRKVSNYAYGEDMAVVFVQVDGKKWKQLAQVLTKWFEGDVHSQRVRAVMAATALCDKIQCKHIEATDNVIKPERNRLVAHFGGRGASEQGWVQYEEARNCRWG